MTFFSFFAFSGLWLLSRRSRRCACDVKESCVRYTSNMTYENYSISRTLKISCEQLCATPSSSFALARCKWGANHELCNSREPWRWICIMESDFPLLHCINVKIVSRDRARLCYQPDPPAELFNRLIDEAEEVNKCPTSVVLVQRIIQADISTEAVGRWCSPAGISSRYQLLWRDYLRLSRFN